MKSAIKANGNEKFGNGPVGTPEEWTENWVMALFFSWRISHIPFVCFTQRITPEKG
jgi:hypothetical protein